MRRIFPILTLTAALFAAVSLCAQDILLDKARSGDMNAQLQLGGEYFYGKNRKGNLPLALYWFRRAAIAGSPQGQYNFAMCLLHGWGGEKNPAAAFVFFERAMQNNVTQAAVRYAEMLFTGVAAGTLDGQPLAEVAADRKKALDILRLAAQQNSPDAMLLLAKYLFTDAVNHGSELRELLKKYISSTDTPDAEALVIYAACLRSGIGGGVPDPAAGAKVLKQAAKRQHPEAIAQLAEMYFHGFGVPRERTRAMELYQQAIKLDSPRAMTDIGMMKLAGVYMKHDPAGAFELFSRAAEKNYPPALRNLGDCLLMGIGIPAPDIKNGIKYYFRAAEKGDAQSAYFLGMAFKNGKYTEKNLTAAFEFFQQAARAGHSGGMREAGKALLDGSGVKPDTVNGIKLLQFAAENGDREAQEILRR